jgi:TetR/AcrR family acrAB operon transcriptional repressor
MRRSKEDSLKTRGRILVAARKVFARGGVSRTSMEHIAEEAGVTRGAIYGHFVDKADLFRSMREDMKLPMVDVIDATEMDANDDPLTGVERYLIGVLDALKADRATREAVRILAFKCEYVGEFERDMGRQLAKLMLLDQHLERAYKAARRKGTLRADVDPALAAQETCVFLVGAVRMWILDERGKWIRGKLDALVRAHVEHLRVPRARARASRKT